MPNETRDTFGDTPAERRAAAIANHVLGHTAFTGLAWEKMVEIAEYVTAELEVVAEHGFTTKCVSPHCGDPGEKSVEEGLPGLVTWQELQAASEHKGS